MKRQIPDSDRPSLRFPALLVLLLTAALPMSAQTTLSIASTNQPVTSTNLPSWLTHPMSMADALNIAAQQNGTILEAKSDLEASHGIVVQTRAIAIPKVQANGNFTRNENGPSFIFPNPSDPSNPVSFTGTRDNWNSGVQVVQSIYEGGRIRSSFRTARLTRDQALLQYQTVVADTLLRTRIAYYDVLVAEQQILVNEASVSLLTRELNDQRSRYEAGTIPRFNVLRAEVAVANAKPELFRSRNAHRVAKNALSNLLGYNLPREVWEDIPLQLTDRLEAPPYQIDLPSAISQALERRTELGALRKAEQLQEESVVNAQSGYKPSLQAFAGYGWQSAQGEADLADQDHGWNFGGQISWNIFDGMLTRGRVIEAKAQRQKAKTVVDDESRRIELEVRTFYSSFMEAQEVLDSQLKVQEQAEEALRLAKARTDAGTGTQLEVLDAETALTEARTTQVEALHRYAVARSRLERAIGKDMTMAPAK